MSAISYWELALLVSRGRILLDVTIDDWFARVVEEPRFEIAPLTPAIAILGTRLGERMHRDPSDRLIVATAVQLGIPLVTRDAAIARAQVPGLEVIW